MRTTIGIDDRLLVEAKKYAAETGRTLAGVIEDALREKLRARREARPHPVRLTVFGRGGLMPGVDLDDSAPLRDLMDEPGR